MFQGQTTTLLGFFLLLGVCAAVEDLSLVQKQAVMAKSLGSKDGHHPHGNEHQQHHDGGHHHNHITQKDSKGRTSGVALGEDTSQVSPTKEPEKTLEIEKEPEKPPELDHGPGPMGDGDHEMPSEDGDDNKDCLMADWGKWGECTKTCASSKGELAGKKVRYRHVKPLNCARSFEEMECANLPCPIDCVMSDWEEWDTCDKECENEGARQNRTRKVVTKPEHGGMCCPDTKECADKAEPECGPALTIDYKDCGAEKKMCEPSLWSEWSPCSQTCDTGKKSRTRMIKTPATCGGAPCLCDFLEVKNCEVKSCLQECVLSAWSEWSKCPVTCGGSAQTRSRSVITPPSGGAPDCAPLVESKNCGMACCKRDCVLSSWEPWTFCSASCYGTQKRTRKVEVTPCGVGHECDALFEARECNHDCVLPCLVGEWGPWSECSATCGGGSKIRERAITQQEANGGANCPPLFEAACCDESNVGCEAAPAPPPEEPAPAPPPVVQVYTPPPPPQEEEEFPPAGFTLLGKGCCEAVNKGDHVWEGEMPSLTACTEKCKTLHVEGAGGKNCGYAEYGWAGSKWCSLIKVSVSCKDIISGEDDCVNNGGDHGGNTGVATFAIKK